MFDFYSLYALTLYALTYVEILYLAFKSLFMQHCYGSHKITLQNTLTTSGVSF